MKNNQQKYDVKIIVIKASLDLIIQALKENEIVTNEQYDKIISQINELNKFIKIN